MTIDQALDVDSTLSIWRNENGNISIELWRPTGVVVVKAVTLIEALAKLEATLGDVNE